MRLIASKLTSAYEVRVNQSCTCFSGDHLLYPRENDMYGKRVLRSERVSTHENWEGKKI